MPHHAGGHGSGLGTWQLLMLALGTVVGGSFFLGTAIILQVTGPATLLVFAIGGAVIFLILRALSELTVGRPAHGSFREYAEQALGPMAGYVVGWLYWTGLVLAMSSEAVAVAVFARLWLPALPLWLMAGAIILAVTAVNLLDPHLFGRVETLMAGAKLGAVALFILFGLGLAAGLLPGRGAPGLAALQAGPWAPGGAAGLAGSMLLVIFTYAGFEVIGLAAPDAREPQRTVPRAIALTTAALVVLYLLTFATVLLLLPAGAVSTEVAPMVAALRQVGAARAAAVMNLVVMSAGLSTMLAALYGLGRMLYSLAQEGQAPALFGRLSPGGAPRAALAASGLAMLVGAALGYVLPRQVYLYLASAGGFSLLFTYLMILVCQLRLRHLHGCPPGGCQMPGFPYLTWVGIVLILVIILSMPLVPGQGAGLVAGLSLLVAIAGAYRLGRRPAAGPVGPVGDAGGGENEAHIVDGPTRLPAPEDLRTDRPDAPGGRLRT